MADDDYDSPWSTWNGTQSVVDTVADNVGVPNSFIDPQKSFTDNGGDSLTALTSLLDLKRDGHSLTLEEFLSAHTLKQAADISLNNTICTLENNVPFVKRVIKDLDPDEARNLIATSFVMKGDLERCRDDLKPEDMAGVLKRAWPMLQKYSFGLVDEHGKLRAVATAADLADLDHLTFDGLHPHLQDVFPYLNHLVEKVADQIPAAEQPGVVLEKFMFGTSVENSSSENILLMYLMEKEFHETARKAGFKASVAQNASPLTQQLAELMGCKTLIKHNAHDFVAPTGNRPFIKCRDPTYITVDMMVY